MKKKKNKIKEGALSQGITSYDTSNSTSSSSTSSGVKKPVVYSTQQDLKKTTDNLKGTDTNIVVQKENVGIKADLSTVLKPSDFSYLSEVKDSKTGEISKPFTINGKQYQMCRAVTPKREKVMAVYSLDERDESGKNILYNLQEFEEHVAKKAVDEVEEPETSEEPEELDNTGSAPTDSKKPEFFRGCKHFIVNTSNGKVKKFKTIGDLAKAHMEEGEKYMGIKEFKRYLDESLFGKRNLKEEEPLPNAAPAATPAQGTAVPTEPAVVTHLMDLIDKALPSDVYTNIKQNPNAQSAAIIAWLTRVGVPANKVNDIINSVRTLSKQVPAKPATTPAPAPTQAAAPVSENRYIIKTIKVKDIK